MILHCFIIKYQLNTYKEQNLQENHIGCINSSICSHLESSTAFVTSPLSVSMITHKADHKEFRGSFVIMLLLTEYQMCPSYLNIVTWVILNCDCRLWAWSSKSDKWAQSSRSERFLVKCLLTYWRLVWQVIYRYSCHFINFCQMKNYRLTLCKSSTAVIFI